MRRADVIGIDMSGAFWRAAHLARGPSGVELVSEFRLEGTREEMASQLKGYVEELRSGQASIALAMPRGSCITKVLSLPAADRVAAARMLGFELERHLPSDATQWRWSVGLVKREGAVSTIMLSAVKARDVEDISNLFAQASLHLALITTGQAALRAALTRSGFVAAGELTAIVPVSENAFALHAVRDNMLLYSAEAPVSAARREFGFAISSLKESPQSFVIIDEGANENIMEAVSLEARGFCDVTKVFGPVPALSRAFGAALMYAESGHQGANLACRVDGLPARVKALAGAFAAMLVLLAAGAGIAVNDFLAIRDIEKEIASVDYERIKARAVMERSVAIKSDLKTLDEMMGAGSMEFLQILGRLTELTPEDTYLTGLEYGKDRIMVDGISRKASGLVMTLSRSGFASDISYEGPVVRAPGGMERFRIKFRQTGGQGSEDTRSGS